MADTSVADIVERLIRGYRSADRQEPSGFVVEREGDAPRLVQFGSPRRPVCCRGGDPPAGEEAEEEVPIGGPIRPLGIRVFLRVSYRGSAGNGVTRVTAQPLDRQGNVPAADALQPATWEPTDEERARSRKQSISRTFSICFDCESLTRDHTARFLLSATDENANLSVQVVGVTVGHNQFLRCCAV